MAVSGLNLGLSQILQSISTVLSGNASCLLLSNVSVVLQVDMLMLAISVTSSPHAKVCGRVLEHAPSCIGCTRTCACIVQLNHADQSVRVVTTRYPFSSSPPCDTPPYTYQCPINYIFTISGFPLFFLFSLSFSWHH